jgi:hypothetical protein
MEMSDDDLDYKKEYKEMFEDEEIIKDVTDF